MGYIYISDGASSVSCTEAIPQQCEILRVKILSDESGVTYEQCLSYERVMLTNTSITIF